MTDKVMTSRIDFDIIEEDMDMEDTMTCLYCGKQYDMLDGGFGSFCSMECEDAYEQDPNKDKDKQDSKAWSEEAEIDIEVYDEPEDQEEPTDWDELPF